MKRIVRPGWFPWARPVLTPKPSAPSPPPTPAPGAFVVYADGSSLNGAGARGPAGWAAVVVAADGSRRTVSGGSPRACNFDMEVAAIAGGLAALPEGSTATVYTDFAAIVEAAAGRARWCNRYEPVAVAAARLETVKLLWLRGHQGHADHNRADRLAREAAGTPDQKNAASRMIARCRAARHAGACDRNGRFPPRKTLGWSPSCRCPAAPPVPCVVLDPFLGSGTSAMVALRLGREGWGVELGAQNVLMARRRIRDDAPLLNTVEVVDA